MTLRTFLSSSDQYLFIKVVDARDTYYEGYVWKCMNKKELWDREIKDTKQLKNQTLITLRIRRKRREVCYK